jgi:hypothetical protein
MMQAEILSRHPTVDALRAMGARGPWIALLDAILKLAGSSALFAGHTERPWASVTFSGARHRFRFVFEGHPAVARGEAFLAALPDHPFDLRGQLVADTTIVAVDHDLANGPRLTIEAELLVLEDA